MANNWKQKQIKNILILQQEMIDNNIDQILIDQYIKDQYEIIIKQYNLKIEKSNNNSLNYKQTKGNRNKEIANLIKNKLLLDKNGYNQEYINDYVNKQYIIINENYKTINKCIINNEYNINFID